MRKVVRKDHERCLGKPRTAGFSFAMPRMVAHAHQIDKVGLAETNALYRVAAPKAFIKTDPIPPLLRISPSTAARASARSRSLRRLQ